MLHMTLVEGILAYGQTVRLVGKGLDFEVSSLTFLYEGCFSGYVSSDIPSVTIHVGNDGQITADLSTRR